MWSLEFLSSHSPKLTRDVGVAGRERGDRAALDYEDEHVVDRFGREVMCAASTGKVFFDLIHRMLG